MNLVFGIVAITACGGEPDPGNSNSEVGYFEGVPEPVDGTCTSVRLTTYEANGGGWCEWTATHDFLPQFVRDGMHTAIAEPWNGGSFQGESGEACGECWEVSTVNGTGIVMVNNLCPIEGNPLCSGGHFHFDLSQEAGAALGGGGLDEASTKRVPCPVTGNIHVQVNDANEWGYLRFAVLNHRIPVRKADVALSPDGPWITAERSGGAMHVRNGPTPGQSDGIYFRLTSAMDETVISTMNVPYLAASGSAYDLGVQFEQTYADSQCVYQPPGDVFDDAWGGIEGVRWRPNPWGDGSSVTETRTDCYRNSAACLAVTLDTWGGAHFYYRQAFGVNIFTTVSFQVKAATDMQLTAAPSNEGERCTEKQVTLPANQWTPVTFNLAEVCSGFEQINGITISGSGTPTDMRIDDIRFE